MIMKRTSVTTYFRVDIDFLREMEEARQKLGQTRTQFILDAIAKHLEDLRKDGIIEKVYKVRSEK